MSKRKAIVLYLAVVLSLGMLTGCGKKMDASAYVKALLDNTYKNDPSGILEQKIGTEEEAAELYEQGLDAVMASLVQENISEELKDEYRTVLANLYSKVKYTVGEFEEQEDGSLVVTINCEQMKVFEPAMTAYIEAVAELSEQYENAKEEVPSEEKQNEMTRELFKECIKDALSNVTYETEVSTTVRVELDDQVYSLNTEDFMNLESSLLDLNALTG